MIYVVRGRAERMKLLAAVSVAPPPPPPSPLKKWLSLSLSLSLTHFPQLVVYALPVCLPACLRAFLPGLSGLLFSIGTSEQL